ncbi:MAG: hypothetical protein RJQ05_06060 [Cytophagales bacterium]
MNDPESGQFSPDIGNLALSIDSSKDVTLIWNDISDFEDGFIIQKSYENKESFFDLDTLPANSSRYIDSTKKLAVDTFYRVHSFSESSDSLGSTEIDRLVLNPLESITVPDVPGNEISISWEAKPAGYADAYLIEKSFDNKNWSIIETVSNSVSSYSLREKENFFRIYIRISPILIDFESENPKINTLQEEAEFNFPSGLEINQLNEAYLEFKWNNESHHDYSYIIYSRGINTACCDRPSTKWLPIDTVSNLNSTSFVPIISSQDYQREFSIVAMNENGVMSRKSKTSIFNFCCSRTPSPHSLSIEPISSTEVKLTWGVYHSELAIEYQISISENNGGFNLYKKLDPTDFEVIVDKLDSTKTYDFKIKTYRSSSEYLKINYEPDLVLLKDYSFSLSRNDNNSLAITDNRIFAHNNVINLSTLELNNFSTIQYSWGLSLSDDLLYYSFNDLGNFEIQIFDRSTSDLTSTKTFENHGWLTPKFLHLTDEVILSYTDITTNESQPILEIWDENFQEMRTRLNVNSIENFSCHQSRISYLLPAPSEKFALIVCGSATNEGIFTSGGVVKVDLYDLNNSEVMFPDISIVRDLIYQNDDLVYFISRDKVIHYDLKERKSISSIDLLQYGGLYDLQFSNHKSKLFTIGTRSSNSTSDSKFFILDSSSLSIIEEIDLQGKMYFARELSKNRFFISGEANKYPRSFSGIFELKNGWLTK